MTRRCLPQNQWECFSSKYITIIQIYSNIALIHNCYWIVDEKATNRLNDSPSAVRTSLPLVIFQQIPEVLFLKGQNNFMGEGFGPRAKQKIAKALWQRCLDVERRRKTIKTALSTFRKQDLVSSSVRYIFVTLWDFIADSLTSITLKIWRSCLLSKIGLNSSSSYDGNVSLLTAAALVIVIVICVCCG